MQRFQVHNHCGLQVNSMTGKQESYIKKS